MRCRSLHSSRCTLAGGGRPTPADRYCAHHPDPGSVSGRAVRRPSVRTVSTWVPRDRRTKRIVRCVAGLALFGFGITLLLRAELGAAPWDVFHTGVTDLTGIPTGTVIINSNST